MELLITQFSSACCDFIPLRSKCSQLPLSQNEITSLTDSIGAGLWRRFLTTIRFAVLNFISYSGK
jgi:hypothetical protein